MIVFMFSSLKVFLLYRMFNRIFPVFLFLITLCILFSDIISAPNNGTHEMSNATNNTDYEPAIDSVIVFPCREGYVMVRGECVKEY